jgi:pyridoxal phosphate enzyme (YggS family)
MAVTADIPARLAEIRGEIAEAARRSARDPASVKLVAVAKTHPAEAVEAALAAGQRLFGENRVQEAAGKYPSLIEAYPDLELHLIGPLQTNKLRDALRIFDVIETVDRVKLAEALAAELARGPTRLKRCLIQVNTGEEPQKAGVAPAEADAFIRHCRETLRLPVTGLMAIPPAATEPSPHFALLRTIAKRHGLAELSMGMSADFAIAIQQGATLVRLGTALFGTRD